MLENCGFLQVIGGSVFKDKASDKRYSFSEISREVALFILQDFL